LHSSSSPGRGDWQEAKKTRFKKISLQFEAQVAGMTKAQRDQAVEMEAQMEQQDRIIRVCFLPLASRALSVVRLTGLGLRLQETADARNNLESYIYEWKDKIVGDLRVYTTDTVADSFK
jgi:hypothetical protein